MFFFVDWSLLYR